MEEIFYKDVFKNFEDVLDEIKDTQNRIGLEMWKEFKPAFDRIRSAND